MLTPFIITVLPNPGIVRSQPRHLKTMELVAITITFLAVKVVSSHVVTVLLSQFLVAP